MGKLQQRLHHDHGARVVQARYGQSVML